MHAEFPKQRHDTVKRFCDSSILQRCEIRAMDACSISKFGLGQASLCSKVLDGHAKVVRVACTEGSGFASTRICLHMQTSYHCLDFNTIANCLDFQTPSLCLDFKTPIGVNPRAMGAYPWSGNLPD